MMHSIDIVVYLGHDERNWIFKRRGGSYTWLEANAIIQATRAQYSGYNVKGVII